MFKLYESNFYDVAFRTIITDKKVAKVFTENSSIEVFSEIDFDIDGSEKSSINYLASAIVGGILQNLIFRAKKKRIILEDIEAKIKLQIANPLTILGVIGYDDEPSIKKCDLKIYLYSDMDEVDLVAFCKESLNSSVIYNTLKSSINFNISFIPIL